MVQFIPSPAGTSPYPTPMLAQIFNGLGSVAGGAGRGMEGVGDIQKALRDRMTIAQIFGMGQPPQQPQPMGTPTAGVDGVMSAPPAMPQRPSGPTLPPGMEPYANMQLKHFKAMADVIGKSGFSNMMGFGGGQNVYVGPDGTTSLIPLPGYTPLRVKPDTALRTMSQQNSNKYRAEALDLQRQMLEWRKSVQPRLMANAKNQEDRMMLQMMNTFMAPYLSMNFDQLSEALGEEQSKVLTENMRKVMEIASSRFTTPQGGGKAGPAPKPINKPTAGVGGKVYRAKDAAGNSVVWNGQGWIPE